MAARSCPRAPRRRRLCAKSGRSETMTTAQFLIGLLSIAVALCAIMAGAWAVQQRTGNSGWVDTIWTFGLGAVGCASALAPLNGAPGQRQFVTAVFIVCWALRLGIHIA